MEQLTVGKKTNQELAKWFGVKANTFGNQKKRRLEELKLFAEYHMMGTKVIIDKVIIPEYDKEVSRVDNYTKVRDEVNPTWSKNGLDSCKRVAEVIFTKLSAEEDFKIKGSTVYEYTKRARNELYGRPFGESGKLGRCEYIWCKKYEDGTYDYFTEEEQKIRDRLIKKYFGNVGEKQLIVKQMVKDGELKAEDAFEYLEEITNMGDVGFAAFQAELQSILNSQVVKATKVEWSAYSD